MGSQRSNYEEKIYLSYLYPGTRVLKNKLGIQDPVKLEQAELFLTSERMRQPLPASARELTYKGYLAIHHHLFQDIYDWAGKPRDYTTGRGPVPFAPPENIESWMQGQFRILKNENYLRGLSREEFSKKVAPIINEINAAHPFIEGNGRTQRLWLQVVAEQAGHRLSLRAEDRDRWYEASRIGFNAVNHKPMADLIYDCLNREPELNKSQTKSIADRIERARSNTNILTPKNKLRPSNERDR